MTPHHLMIINAKELFLISVPIPNITSVPWKILAVISPTAVHADFLNP